MESAVADWDSALTHERLWRWQAALFPAGGTALRQITTGAYRTHDDPMQIVSGAIGREQEHYIAPPCATMRAEMNALIEWFNTSRNAAQRGSSDVTGWLLWFIDIFTQSCRRTATLIDESLARARFWNDHRSVDLNERQRKALNRMLEAGPGRFEGGLTVRKYLGITGAPRTTAWRDLDELQAKGLLVRRGTGRGTRYELSIPGWEWRSGKETISR